MTQVAPAEGRNDDPRRMRELLDRASQLAGDHDLRSVVVGMAGPEGDALFPQILEYVASALRIEDAIFRMTRERAVLLLTDVNARTAREVVERALRGFRECFPTARDPDVWLSYFEITPEISGLRVKDVLPTLFSAAPAPN